VRIVELTPGTGSFYCGTCLRDNALVTELRRQGHDALMAPLYLPLTLDEPASAGNTPLFYGGVNVYLQQKVPFFRRTPRWLDRLLDLPGVLSLAASRAGSTRAQELGDLTVSMLLGEEGRQVKELERLTEWLAEVRPDVVLLSNALLVGMAREVKRRCGAAVVCTLQGEDGFLDDLPEPDRTKAWHSLAERAQEIDGFVAVSRYYAGVMTERAQLPADRVHVVPNGILLDGYAPAASPPDPPVLGFLARLHRLKGLKTLVEAYILLRTEGRAPRLRLHVAGSMTETDRPFVDEMQALLAKTGAAEDVALRSNVSRDEKIAFLQGLTVLSVPATYGEAFGLYVIEALAAGVPVVQPRHAAFPEILAATGGGLLCEPDDPRSLADGIETLLRDPAAARAMGARGREVVLEQYSVARMAEGVARVCEQAARGRHAVRV
jgi:glycosyltransferase involved in cell wall biosynthesis